MPDTRYAAFISYSHRDESWGRWAHQTLETYRVPKATVGSAGRDGPVPERLGRVFRDREEFPTSADLGSALVDALDNSAYLVVLCSPESARSRWVNEEVLHFKRTGRASRIFPVIVGGEPNATDRGRPEDECFPPAVRFALGEDGELTEERVEPIAADARPGRDGRRDAGLKLIAGMLGTDFDALKQREVRRRRQRRTRLVIGASVVATAVVTSGLVALSQGARATRAEERVGEIGEIARNLKNEWVRGGAQTTPAIDAVLLGDTDELERLNPSPEEINELWGPEELNLLMIAAAVGHADVTAWLLNHGADPGIYNPHGDAAIHIAASRGRPGAFEPLMNAGVDLDMPWRSRGGQGWRPIDIAANDESIPALEELLRLGVSTERELDGFAPTSPLLMAAYFGQAEAIRVLLDAGADPKVRSFDGETPYAKAIQAGHNDVADMLAPRLGTGKQDDLNQRLREAGTGLLLGMTQVSDIENLLESGADPNYVDPEYGEFAVPIFAEYLNMLLPPDSPGMPAGELKAGRERMLGALRLMLESGVDLEVMVPAPAQTLRERALSRAAALGDPQLEELIKQY